MNRLNRLISLQLHHQIREAPIRLHQPCVGADEPIRQLAHAPKEAILKHPVRLVHEVGQLDREAVHARLIPGHGRNLGHDDGPAVARVHALEVLDAGVAVGAVVVEPDVVGRVGGDEAHKLLEPLLAVGVVGHGRPDQLLAPMLPQRHHLVVPGLRRALRGDVVLVGLVEEVDDGLVAVEDVLPVRARELGFEVDHGPEGGAGVELRRDPGVPVADGGEGPVEVALVQGPWDARIAGAGAVGPVPEEAALLDYHCDTII